MKLRPLTKAERALVHAMHDKHGIAPATTRYRIRVGWPEGRLHEQPILDPKRNAQTRRQTPKMRPKPNHAWRKWRGDPKDNKRTTP